MSAYDDLIPAKKPNLFADLIPPNGARPSAQPTARPGLFDDLIPKGKSKPSGGFDPALLEALPRAAASPPSIGLAPTITAQPTAHIGDATDIPGTTWGDIERKTRLTDAEAQTLGLPDWVKHTQRGLAGVGASSLEPSSVGLMAVGGAVPKLIAPLVTALAIKGAAKDVPTGLGKLSAGDNSGIEDVVQGAALATPLAGAKGFFRNGPPEIGLGKEQGKVSVEPEKTAKEKAIDDIRGFLSESPNTSVTIGGKKITPKPVEKQVFDAPPTVTPPADATINPNEIDSSLIVRQPAQGGPEPARAQVSPGRVEQSPENPLVSKSVAAHEAPTTKRKIAAAEALDTAMAKAGVTDKNQFHSQLISGEINDPEALGHVKTLLGKAAKDLPNVGEQVEPQSVPPQTVQPPSVSPAPVSDTPIASHFEDALRGNDWSKLQQMADQLPEPSNRGKYTLSDANRMAHLGEGHPDFTRLTVRGKPLWKWINEVREQSNSDALKNKSTAGRQASEVSTTTPTEQRPDSPAPSEQKFETPAVPKTEQEQFVSDLSELTGGTAKARKNPSGTVTIQYPSSAHHEIEFLLTEYGLDVHQHGYGPRGSGLLEMELRPSSRERPATPIPQRLEAAKGKLSAALQRDAAREAESREAQMRAEENRLREKASGKKVQATPKIDYETLTDAERQRLAVASAKPIASPVSKPPEVLPSTPPVIAKNAPTEPTDTPTKEVTETATETPAPISVIQKYRLKNTGPQLWTKVRELPPQQGDLPDEKYVEVKNDRTGKLETVIESDLKPVAERTAAQKAEAKAAKIDVDAELKKRGYDTKGMTKAQKAETLKRDKAKNQETGPGMIGMGGARAGVAMSEQGGPSEPPIADAGTVAPAPEQTPRGFLRTMSDAASGVSTWLKGVAGESLPKITKADRETGEAGVRLASSRIAARPQADTFVSEVLKDSGIDPKEFGAALTEDNLESVREGFEKDAEKLESEGKHDEAAQARDRANGVRSIIGGKGSPFQTQEQYLDFLERPEVKEAIGRHKQLWSEVVEPQYKEAMSLDPDEVLPSRGRMTDARVNLKAVRPGEQGKAVVRGVGRPGITKTFKKQSPFGARASGAGEAYDLDYNEIIGNTFEKQLEIANQNVFHNQLINSGNAAVGNVKGNYTFPDGEGSKAYPLARRLVVVDKGGQKRVFAQGQNIYVRNSLVPEYEGAMNLTERHHWSVATPVFNALNKAALAGLTDATVHSSNLFTALFNNRTLGKYDTALSAFGRADIPLKLAQVVKKALTKNKVELAELYTIGAGRPETGGKIGANLLRKLDTNVRLVLQDAFNDMVKEGMVEDTETNRREFINQVGQYNRRLQGPVIRFLRETGIGPFATAGRTFGAMGVKMATLTPSAKSANTMGAIMQRANMLSKWVGLTTALAVSNWYFTHDKGGGVMGRPGTPIGKLDTGLTSKSGKPLLLPAADLIGLGRALRITGAGPFIDSKRNGLTTADAFDSAKRGIVNSVISPVAGPAVRFGSIAATGYPAAIEVGRASRVAPPGHNQFLENVNEAAKEANPLVKSGVDFVSGKSLGESLASQIPRFTLTEGKHPDMMKNYPEIVSKAQGKAYIDDVARRARELPPEQRRAFVEDAISKLPHNQREHARNEIRYRHVYQ